MKTCGQCTHNKPTGRTYTDRRGGFVESKKDQCQKEHPIGCGLASKCKDYKWAGDGKDYVINHKGSKDYAPYSETRKRGN